MLRCYYKKAISSRYGFLAKETSGADEFSFATEIINMI